MKKQMQWFAVVLAAVLFLVGCQGIGTKEGAGDKNKDDTTIENTKNKEGDTARKNRRNDNDKNRDITNNVRNNDKRDNNFRSNHRSSNNTQDEYDVSTEAADRIVDEIADIDRAYVLTTKHNAYVAAQLNEKNESAKDPIAKNDRNNNSTGTNIRNTNDRNVKDRTVNEGDSNRRGPDNHIGNRRDTESDDVTDDVKNQIADIVQETDNNIDNVYVSTSPDFFDLANNYSDDMDNGKPVRGFFDQIGNTIERIFPQNKR